MTFSPLSFAFTAKDFSYQKIDTCVLFGLHHPRCIPGGRSELVPMKPG